jgi:5-methylcytosine-specific restriction enzyme subunit McrC
MTPAAPPSGAEVIPVRNIYYLLCYAWDQWDEGPPVVVDEVDGASVLELLALVLARGTSRLLKQGLHREYRSRALELAGVRGKLLLAPTLGRGLLERGRTISEVDELSVDTPANRIIRGTLETLVRDPSLAREVHLEVRAVRDRFPSTVPVMPLRAAQIRRIPVHRNNRSYGLLLQICRLIQQNLLVSPDGRGETFQDFRKDSAQMWRIFELFLERFLAREFPGLKVAGGKEIAWHGVRGTEAHMQRLPRMKTDIVVASSERILILDAKFYKDAFSGRFGKKGVRSSHLYQLLTYLGNRAAADREERARLGRAPRAVDGVLVYPVVNEAFDLRYAFPGHGVRVCSVDLSVEWPRVREEVRGLVG